MTAAPHDLESERGLLGDLMSLPHHIPAAMASVAAGDFYSPAHKVVFAAIVELHETGHTVNGGTVREQLKQSGDLEHCGGDKAIAGIAGASTGGWRKHAETVARLAALRRVLTVSMTLTEQAFNPASDPLVLVAEALRDLESVELPSVDLPTSLISIDAMLDEAEMPGSDVRLPWVIPGQLREGWRCMIIAPEGTGKSTATRQMAMCAAQGVHPFIFRPIPRVPTLIVDLENPVEAITETAKPIRDKLRAKNGVVYQDHGCWVWHVPGGVNLRAPRWRAEFERILAAVQPKLVCLGPMYKAYRTSTRESDELAAAEMQNVLDDLRVRFGFALILEHHAPKGAGGIRDLVPYGSSLWLRWPEFGLKLVPDDQKNMQVQRWRQDRLQANWPDELHRGGIDGWPWVGYWKHGIEEF